MKKLVVTILSILYLTTSTGATVHLHYCMGMLVSWGLKDIADNSKCAKCSMEKKNGCCGDKKVEIKVDKDQKKLDASSSPNQPPVILINHTYSDYRFSYSSQNIKQLPKANALPYLAQVPTYILNCVFRI